MATITTAPFGTYTDATGVVDTTAAAEIVALGVILKGIIAKTTYSEGAAGQGASNVGDSEVPATSPEFDKIARHTAELIEGEVDGFLAAIAAAPTA